MKNKYIFFVATAVFLLVSFFTINTVSAQTTTPVPLQTVSPTPTPITVSPFSLICYRFDKNLNRGDIGVDVVALQTWLIGHNFHIPLIEQALQPKGFYGPQTVAAVREYQISVGLSPAEGNFGPKTRDMVNVSCNSANPPILGPTQTVTVLKPNGGEVINAGASTTIEWKATLPSNLYEVRLVSFDSGQPNVLIKEVKLPSPVTDYKLNVLFPSKVIASRNYKINVCDMSRINGEYAPCDLSDNFIRVESDYVRPNLNLQLGISPVNESIITGGSMDVKLADISMTAKGGDIGLGEIVISGTPGNSKALDSFKLYGGGVKLGEALITNHSTNFLMQMPLSLVIPKDSTMVLTLKADARESGTSTLYMLSGVGGLPGGDGFTVDFNSVSKTFVVRNQAYTQPSITVTNPNGGGYWKQNEAQVVTWTSVNIPASNNMKIVARHWSSGQIPDDPNNPGSIPLTDYVIAESVPNSGSARVSMAGLPVGPYSLHIKTPGANDWSDSYFKIISDSNSPSLTVKNPNGGGYWYRGDSAVVEWKSVGIPSDNKILIRLRAYDTGYEYPLTISINDGYEKLFVPTSIPVGAYTLEVKTDVGGQSYMDGSDSYFKVVDTLPPVEPPLTIYGPWVVSTQSEKVFVGQRAQFTSTYGGTFKYSCGQDGALSGVTLYGTFYCTYSSSGDKTVTISSDSAVRAQKSFVVLSTASPSSITLTSPTSNQNFAPGSVVPLRWTSQNYSGGTAVDVLTADEKIMLISTSLIGNPGAYDFTLSPNTNPGSYIARVRGIGGLVSSVPFIVGKSAPTPSKAPAPTPTGTPSAFSNSSLNASIWDAIREYFSRQQ